MKFQLLGILFLMIINIGCSNLQETNNLYEQQRTAIYGKELGEVQNCDDLVLYFTDNDTNISYYTKCVKGIEVSYSDIKLADTLKDAIHDKRTSLKQMIESAKDAEKKENHTVYKYVNFNMLVCKQNNKVIFSLLDDKENYCE